MLTEHLPGNIGYTLTGLCVMVMTNITFTSYENDTLPKVLKCSAELIGEKDGWNIYFISKGIFLVKQRHIIQISPIKKIRGNPELALKVGIKFIDQMRPSFPIA